MVPLTIPFKLLLALLLGAAVGLERESYEKELISQSKIKTGTLGVRSFALFSLLGAVAGTFQKFDYTLFILITSAFAILMVAFYVLGSVLTKDNGVTTEIAAIFTYLIGLMITVDIFPIQLVIALTVVLIVILSLKDEIRFLISGIKHNELNAFLGYFIIALVILPFLPNNDYRVTDVPGLITLFGAYGINIKQFANIVIFNPFSLWRVVVIITGVEMFGYVLERTIGQTKGWLLTSIAGGFVSSTSTTQALAQRSKHATDVNKLVSAAIFSNWASFLQHAILIASINIFFFTKNTLYLLAIVTSAFLVGFYYLKRDGQNPQENLTETKEMMQRTQIFSLKPALIFALVYLVVTIVSKFSIVLFGETGLFITSALASVSGLDAVTINISQLSGSTISFQSGVIALIIANAVNLLAKVFYAFVQGKKNFFYLFTIGILIIILSSLLGLLPFIV